MNVYWAVWKDELIPSAKHYPPEKAIYSFPNLTYRDPYRTDHISGCPAFVRYFENTYVLKWPVSYSLNVNSQGELTTNDYDQEFFDNFILPREIRKRIYSFSTQYIFIAEQSLEIEVTKAHTVNTDFTRKVVMVPGLFDIGKWYRPLEIAAIIDSNCDNISLVEGEPCALVRFKTKNKINLKRVHLTPETKEIISRLIHTRHYPPLIKNHRPLEYFYDMLKQSGYRKYILKQIKENEL